MESKEEFRRRKRKVVIQYTFGIIFALFFMIFVILKDAPAPWRDPLGFIWFILTQPEPGPWGGIFLPNTFWVMLFILAIYVWWISLYEYIKGREIYYGKFFLIWALLIIPLSIISVMLQDYAYYGLSDTLVTVGMILLLIIIALVYSHIKGK
jgi:hypothetical protein